MKIATAITFRNERSHLRANILYHRYLGVDTFYVFSDDTTDDTIATIEDLPGVHLQRSVPPHEVEDGLLRNSDIRYILDEWENHVCARQMLNCCVAIQLARRAGHDWLISIDSDELVCPDTTRLEPGHLSRCFGSIAPSTQALVFLPIEVIGRRVEYPGLIFREETLFKNVFVRSETSGRLVPSVDLSRRIHDPIHDEHVTLPGYTGHVEGKSAVRLGQDVVPSSVHHFKGPGMTDLRQEQATWLLHYHTYSFSDFLRRNRNFADRPNYFVLGNTRMPWVPDRLFQEMVNSGRFDEDELRTYYTAWLSSDDQQLERMRARSRDSVVEVTAVRDVFEKSLPHQADPLFL